MLVDMDVDSYGNYYFIGFKREKDSLNQCAYLLKLNNSGTIVSEKVFCQNDSSLFFEKIMIINDTVFVFGYKGSAISSYKNILWKLKLNNDLDFLQSGEQKVPANTFEMGIQSILFKNEKFILLGLVIPMDDMQLYDIGFYKINKNLDSVSTYVDFRQGIQRGMDFKQIDANSGYEVFGNGYYPGTYTSYDELVRFDSNFHFLNVDSVPWQLKNQFTYKQYDSSSYLLCGNKHYYNPTNFDVGLIRLNESEDLIKMNHYGKATDTSDYPSVKKTVDFIYKNCIYLGGTSNLLADQYPWQSEDSWLMLNQLDSNLNIKWQTFYGGDAFYHLRGLKATNDGGCLMYATRYDENTQDQEFDIYILKVDSLGLMTSTGDHFTIPVQQLSIVPNPANQYVAVSYPDIFGNEEKEIVIYNSLGIPVMGFDATEEASGISADISELPAGLYFVVLRVNGKKAGTGKLIVTHP